MSTAHTKKRIGWTKDLDRLLIWMRGKGMGYRFCAEVIGREIKRTISHGACVARYYKMKGMTR